MPGHPRLAKTLDAPYLAFRQCLFEIIDPGFADIGEP
jgi:hypothetical protein